MVLLEAKNLDTYYGKSQILHDLSLTVDRGEVVALIGRNGVGKSTTLRCLMGLTPPRRGSILWKGAEIARQPSFRNALSGLGYVPEDRRIFSGLTVWENLDVARLPARDGQAPWDEARIFDFFPDLARFRDRQGGLLSGGQQQMLTIARSLMGNPDLLLLDEPSEGIAPIVVETIRLKVAELKAAGMSIILAEQNLEFVLSLADRCFILEKGAVVYQGSAADLKSNEAVQAKYLHI